MPGYQFARMETFSLKGTGQRRTVREVLDENERLPGNAPHVPDPKPPRLIYGMMPTAVADLIDENFRAAKKAARGTGRGNGPRRDSHVLVGQVYSHPVPCAEIEDHREAYDAWVEDCAAFAAREAERNGWRLASIVEHTDEAFPHLHALFVVDPTTDTKLDVRRNHPGHRHVDPDAPGRERSRQYREAMRGWQDLFHAEVAAKNGLTRLGPGRQRLSRAAWQQRKQEAALMAERIRDIERDRRIANDNLDTAARQKIWAHKATQSAQQRIERAEAMEKDLKDREAALASAERDVDEIIKQMEESSRSLDAAWEVAGRMQEAAEADRQAAAQDRAEAAQELAEARSLKQQALDLINQLKSAFGGLVDRLLAAKPDSGSTGPKITPPPIP